MYVCTYIQKQGGARSAQVDPGNNRVQTIHRSQLQHEMVSAFLCQRPVRSCHGLGFPHAPSFLRCDLEWSLCHGGGCRALLIAVGDVDISAPSSLDPSCTRRRRDCGCSSNAECVGPRDSGSPSSPASRRRKTVLTSKPPTRHAREVT